MSHKYAIGDQVVFTNIFGVCWGVKTITGQDERNGPTYHYEPTDTPWFSTNEENLTLADTDDIVIDMWANTLDKWQYFQNKYGFIPSDYYGCY